MEAKPNIEVFYDGGCPICRMEVDWYSRLDKSNAIHWIDIEQLADRDLPQDKNREDLLNRFHVRALDGQWRIGVDAFASIWAVLPWLRHGAFLFSVPGLRQLAQIGYRVFLKWQRRHRARRKERTA